MYFPGDPLLAFDPIFNAGAGLQPRATAWSPRSTWISPRPDWALGYRFDVVLRGRDATPMGH